jgi:hypothetical protein
VRLYAPGLKPSGNEAGSALAEAPEEEDEPRGTCP